MRERVEAHDGAPSPRCAFNVGNKAALGWAEPNPLNAVKGNERVPAAFANYRDCEAAHSKRGR